MRQFGLIHRKMLMRRKEGSISVKQQSLSAQIILRCVHWYNVMIFLLFGLAEDGS